MAAPTRATPESMNENMPEPSSEAVPASAKICISPKMNMTIPINVTIILAIAPGKMNRRIPITISYYIDSCIDHHQVQHTILLVGKSVGK